MGFVTPQPLFFVRNHGAVPPPQWTISITGLVEKPVVISFAELLEFPQITVPVTLVCAGNRRKEQNLVAKGNGFNWGSAGASNAFFTGVLLARVLEQARPLRAARFVCMEGSDLLPNGYYGTCVSLNRVLDTSNKIMLAHKMNGQDLSPDHGKPIRAVIPGCIGGRSVKWLKKLILTDRPSDNYYHIYDNRVLPTMVTPQMAKEDPKWWLDERYAIYDLNVQSIITNPAHDEIWDLSEGDTQIVSGYAYNGGGIRIGRVELSFDQGYSWNLAEISYPEDDIRKRNGEELFGGTIDVDAEKCFAWCFWSLKVDGAILMQSKDIVVRAMDIGMNAQPRDMYWSVLSMVNNCWHRVVIHREKNGYRFEHPCLPALLPGGWMDRVKKAGGNPVGPNWGELGGSVVVAPPKTPTPQISMVKKDVKDSFSMEEVAKHNREGDSWFVVHNQVYDATPFLKEHPGGAESIILASGMDATEDFMAIHSENALKMLRDYHIGSLDHPLNVQVAKLKVEAQPTFLSNLHWKKARLIEKVSESHDVRIFKYLLEDVKQKLGLPIGQHVYIRVKDLEGKWIQRAYTPISSPDELGYFQLLVKIYFPCPPRFPNGGKLSMLLEQQIVHFDEIQVKGPLGSFTYLESGLCSIKQRRIQITDFCMIAGGSGITPIYQVLHAVLNNPSDPTQCFLIDANRSFEDILCFHQLCSWAEEESTRFQVLHFLNTQPDNAFPCQVGYITKDAIQEFFPAPSPSRLLLICGPPGLVQVVEKASVAIGWTQEQLVVF
jgi:nitrate reductase (NAD(P)H)